MQNEPDPYAQENYQVRLDWGLAGLSRLAAAEIVVVVDTLGLTSAVLAAQEPYRPAGGAAAAVAEAAAAAGARVVFGGIRNASAVADDVLEVQRARGARTAVAIIPVGQAPDAETPRFAVEDLLSAGAVIAALGDLGIDHASPDAAVAGEGYRALGGAVRHLLTASGTGRALAAAGRRDEVLAAAERDAASLVPVLRDGVIVV